MPKSGHVTIRKMKIRIQTRVEKFIDSKNATFSIYDKITKLPRITRFRTVASPDACGVFSTPQF